VKKSRIDGAKGGARKRAKICGGSVTSVVQEKGRLINKRHGSLDEAGKRGCVYFGSAQRDYGRIRLNTIICREKRFEGGWSELG